MMPLILFYVFSKASSLPPHLSLHGLRNTRTSGQAMESISTKTVLASENETCSIYDVIKNFTILRDWMFYQVRPVKDRRRVTIVTISFSLYAVLELNMKTQTLKTFGWFDTKWKNEYVIWDPIDFCGISRMSVALDAVWEPDYFVYEMTDEDWSPKPLYVYISNDGTNVRSEPMLIISTCGVDALQFPFDIQTCTLTLGSFMHTVRDIIYISDINSSVITKISKEIFASKGDWSLLYITVENRNLTLHGSIYSQIQYKITIQRTPSHYIVTLILPACFLVFIDLASMFIPIDGQERLGFKITVVLGFSVLLLILHDLLPSSHGTPMLEVFTMTCLVFMVCSITESIFLSYLLQGETTSQVPKWIKTLVLKNLARAVFVHTKVKDGNEGMATRNSSSLQTTTLLPRKVNSLQGELLMGVLVEMGKVSQILKSLEKEEGNSDWYMVTFVLDRVFFLVYLITILIVTFIVTCVWLI